MMYRAEVDGLRAVAVLPVILFHAGFESFSGGFVGVDIFFVISGYLITTIIIDDMRHQRFSIVGFYERRARRILPALALVSLASIIFAWFILLPDDMRDFAQSITATWLYGSNFLFWLESGYFDASGELKPLLHTWSLAVEEQYYAVFPLLLLISWRFGTPLVLWVLVGLFALSISTSYFGTHWFPSASFYLLPTRFWELLMGSFTAFASDSVRANASTAMQSEAGGVIGVALIAFSVFTFSDATPFPGFFALFPTVGTVLILMYVTPQSLVGRILAAKPLVAVGLVSYSAYLWHQPIFALTRQRLLSEPSNEVFGFLIALSLLLAYLSWRFVEEPFRSRSLFSRKQIFGQSVLVTVLFISFGLWGHFSDGKFGVRSLAAKASSLEPRLAFNYGLHRDCATFEKSERCTLDPQPDILVWGDSYAAHLVEGLFASNSSAKLAQRTPNFCGPVLGVATLIPGRSWAVQCIDFNNAVIEYLEKTPSIRYVVLSSNFGQYMGRVITESGDVVDGYVATRDAFTSTISRIQSLGRHTVIVSPPPKSGSDIGRCLVKSNVFGGDSSTCNFFRPTKEQDAKGVDGIIASAAERSNVLWLEDGICGSQVCYASIAGVFIYRDGGHLSQEGSRYLGEAMDFYGSLLKSAGSVNRDSSE